MARSHSFWLIVDGTVPTAFRAREREDLLPTLHQLQRTQPACVVVWFERGRTWESKEAAREARERRRHDARERKPTWRPGGAHVDPRAKYQITRDEKRARFKKRATFDRMNPKPGADKPAPGGDADQRPPRQGESERRPPRPGQKPWRSKSAGSWAPRDKPTGPWKPNAPWKPKGPWKPRGPGGPGGPRRSGPPRGASGPRGPRGPRGPKSRG